MCVLLLNEMASRNVKFGQEMKFLVGLRDLQLLLDWQIPHVFWTLWLTGPNSRPRAHTDLVFQARHQDLF